MEVSCPTRKYQLEIQQNKALREITSAAWFIRDLHMFSVKEFVARRLCDRVDYSWQEHLVLLYRRCEGWGVRGAHGSMFVKLGGSAGTTRALRLLLLFVLALAAIVYIFRPVLDASPLQTSFYIPGTTPSAVSNEEDSYWSTHIIPAPEPTLSSQATRIQNSTGITTNSLECSTYYDLGPIKVNRSAQVLDIVESKYPEVSLGGRYSPPNCIPRHKVAIIVPYRDREQHLPIFLNHMHPFLMKQQLEYGIFIIEQSGKRKFNRAKLMNVGFEESQKLKEGGWQCFIFHDIDMLPLDGRNLYTCPRQPRHLSVSIDRYNFKLMYPEFFGGVSAMTREQFTKVNGFSNKYWGWGGEDDDMYFRLQERNYHIARYKMSIARYATLVHKKAMPNPRKLELLSQTSKIFRKDGLTTLEYEVFNISQHHLYTHVVVNIDERIVDGVYSQADLWLEPVTFS